MKKKRYLLTVLALVVSMALKPLQVLATSQVDTLLNQMTLKQKITQMLMPDFRKWQQTGETVETNFAVMNDEVANILDQYDFGGVILFAENVQNTKQTIALTQSMQKAVTDNVAQNGNIPLLISIDQEGGIVYRLGEGTALPGNMAIGATRDSRLAKQTGEIIGRELAALGINVNFGPVFDVNNNPNNPVIGLRSFSSDPNIVSELGVSMMEGMQSYHIAATAKHFPGHGDTAVDSHVGLPLVNKTYEELLETELIPFQAAVNNGVDMLMTAHIQYPQIEKDKVVSVDPNKNGESIYLPATLSDDIIKGIVRDKMGYQGIVITDAMTGMDAIVKNFDEVDATVRAIQAGVDIVLMPTVLRKASDISKIDRIIEGVEQAVQTGSITEEQIDASVRRILSLKEKRGILSFKLNDRTEANAKKAVGSEENRQLERDIAASAVTVIKNEDTVLPFKAKKGQKILLLGAYNNELPGLDLGMRRLVDEKVLASDVQFETIRYNKQTTLDDLKEKIDESTHIIVISEIGRESQLAQDVWLTKIPTDVIDYANEKGKQSVVMSISKPYDVANYPNAKAIVAVYGNKGMDPTEALKPDNAFGPNIPAGVEVIFNGKEHKGTLPVAVPNVVDGKLSGESIAYALGHGLFYNDSVKQIKVSVVDQVTQEETFATTVSLGELNGLEKQDYMVKLTVDTNKFSIVPSKHYQIDGNTLIVYKKAMDTKEFKVYLKAKSEGIASPIQTISLVDNQERIFTLGENYYAKVTTKVVKQPKEQEQSDELTQDEVAEQNVKNKQTITSSNQLTTDKRRTGKTLPNTSDIATSGLAFIGLGMIGLSAYFKRKI